jgi:3-dehydroquinate synthetase
MRCDKSQAYDVAIGRPLLGGRRGALARAIGSRSALIITTPTVHRIYGRDLRRWIDASGVHADIEVMSLSEAGKSMDAVLAVCDAARRYGLKRRDVLVAFGGGICCDIVTMAAGLIRRGTPYFCLPTTLVGQIDAGIGLKGAVNFNGHKSYLGCFTPPAAVFADMAWLTTLGLTSVRAGMAEIAKMGLVRDAELFRQLVAHSQRLITSRFGDPPGVGEQIVGRSIELMLDELNLDCYENRGLARLVDYGHTFSPRLEELSGYRLPHGLAVSVDMALSAVVAMELGMLGDADGEAILSGLEFMGLPTFVPLCTSDEMEVALRAAERHRDGRLNLVVPVGVGRATFIQRREDIPVSALRVAIERLRGRWELEAGCLVSDVDDHKSNGGGAVVLQAVRAPRSVAHNVSRRYAMPRPVDDHASVTLDDDVDFLVPLPVRVDANGSSGRDLD